MAGFLLLEGKGDSMRKVLIVDDDWLILEDIRKLIRWESCDFYVPLLAQSAGEAMKIMEKEPIDLIITDISMPEVSGVDFIRAARKCYPDTVFAVLSNYDDFIYVKEAMKAGAVEYLLKYEIEAENLKKFLFQMAKRIQEERRSALDREKLLRMQTDARKDLRRLFWQQLFQGELNEEQLCAQALRLELPVKGGAWIPVVAEFEDKVRTRNADCVWKAVEEAEFHVDDETGIFGTLIKPGLLFLVIYIPEVSFLLLNAILVRVMRNLRESFLCADLPAFWCSGKICMQLKELREGIGGLLEYAYLRFYSGYDTIRSNVQNPVKGQFPETEWDRVQAAVIMEGPDRIEDEWKVFAEAIVREQPSETEIKKWIITKLWQQLEREDTLQAALKQLEKADTCEGFLKQLKQIITDCGKANIILKKIGRREIRETVQFLYRHYNENITLDQLADNACMSRTYFCKVFKEEVGSSYTDFLNKVRIEQAKQLLCKSNLHTREIADRTGFPDYRYFCRLFKQLTGKTCGEYRKGDITENRNERRK